MELIFLGIVIFLFLLAVFDLSVGVSNDAVNFLTSAVGSRAASFRTVIIVAAAGVFIGASMSNGMMDIARHGMFRPENLTFYDIMAIFMAVMVTDIILLDVFNTLGMPTSTTVSMVFELLGATFVVALFKIAQPDSTLHIGDLVNADKALTIILGIFLSVAIAFVTGTLVQFISRLLFTFEYKSRLKWKVGLFGGVACTAIIYFMIIKGVKDLTFMTDDMKMWIDRNTVVIIAGCLVLFTLLSQLMYALRVNVFKMVVLLGTFSLAMAFAGNDLVNFIGVPLTSLASYQEYTAAGVAPDAVTMDSLNGPASTPFYFLIGAGMIMVVSLATSKKARQVTQTTVGLSAQSQSDEMFGSSKLSRTIVRQTINVFTRINDMLPEGFKQWMNKRMDTSKTQPEDGAAFDLVRASVNLMLASMLIAWGTSMKLPLSTTFVTFMVAMGTSLADRAWGRESAVFRVTGVISVIGGWFITAAVAFFGAGIVVCLMHMGGVPVMIAGGILAVVLLIRSNLRFREKKTDTADESTFQTILSAPDPASVWPTLCGYINEKQTAFLHFAASTYSRIAEGFMDNDPGMLKSADKELRTEKNLLKSQRRKMTLCMRRMPPWIALEKNTWFHLTNNMLMSMNYSLMNISDMCGEHVDNNFRLLPEEYHESMAAISAGIVSVINDSANSLDDSVPETIDRLRRRCEDLKSEITDHTHDVYKRLQTGSVADLTVIYVYLNMLQESQELVTALRKLLRASGKLNLAPNSYRSFTRPPQETE